MIAFDAFVYLQFFFFLFFLKLLYTSNCLQLCTLVQSWGGVSNPPREISLGVYLHHANIA